MRLVEHEGKELLRAAGVATPAFAIVEPGDTAVPLAVPFMLKSQVPASDRMRKGGIVRIDDDTAFAAAVTTLYSTPIDGHLPSFLLAEELIVDADERYVSFLYDGGARGPVLVLGSKGGTGVDTATTTPLSLRTGFGRVQAQAALTAAGITGSEALANTLVTLWTVFVEQKLALLEVNPLFVLADGHVIAGDAKVVTDSAVTKDGERPFLTLGGDIAVIASGGGASMLTIDLLMRAGGKPANYVEYSGNPPASVVEELTVRVLSVPDLKGAWIVGGTANFTDTYETMSGFLAGLRRIVPKPAYPIVVRRDGPRLEEARALLEQAAREEGFAITVFGPEASMAESATTLLEKMNAYVHTY